MRFKIDENLPVEIAGLLRAVGYDAMTVIEQELRGANSVVGAVTACHSLLSSLAQEGQALGYAFWAMEEKVEPLEEVATR